MTEDQKQDEPLTFSTISTMHRLGHIDGYKCRSRWDATMNTAYWFVCGMLVGGIMGMGVFAFVMKSMGKL